MSLTVLGLDGNSEGLGCVLCVDGTNDNNDIGQTLVRELGALAKVEVGPRYHSLVTKNRSCSLSKGDMSCCDAQSSLHNVLLC